MKGRTRSFFEDVFVLLLILGVLVAGYYFIFSKDEKKETSSVADTTTRIQTTQPETIKEQIQIEQKEDENIEQNTTFQDNNDTSSEIIIDDKNTKKEQTEEIIEKQVDNTNDIDDLEKEESSPKKVDPNRIAHLVKNVDLKLLKQFKLDVKQAMQEQIVLDNDKALEEQSFSIRITVLKNGEYEQLTFKGGDKELFEKNEENILKIFPLEIDPKIVQDFPRYLRYTFKFSEKEDQ